MTSHVVETCQKTVARNGEKKFVNPTFSDSDIPIPGQWQLATSFDLKRGPTWLDKGETFESVKELLEIFFSDNKKNSSYTVWIGFRPDDPSNLIQDSSIANSAPQSPAKPAKPIKKAPARRTTKIKSERTIKPTVKQEKSSSKMNVRNFPKSDI